MAPLLPSFSPRPFLAVPKDSNVQVQAASPELGRASEAGTSAHCFGRTSATGLPLQFSRYVSSGRT